MWQEISLKLGTRLYLLTSHPFQLAKGTRVTAVTLINTQADEIDEVSINVMVDYWGPINVYMNGSVDTRFKDEYIG